VWPSIVENKMRLCPWTPSWLNLYVFVFSGYLVFKAFLSEEPAIFFFLPDLKSISCQPSAFKRQPAVGIYF
jgi:hypothetical protein